MQMLGDRQNMRIWCRCLWIMFVYWLGQKRGNAIIILDLEIRIECIVY